MFLCPVTSELPGKEHAKVKGLHCKAQVIFSLNSFKTVNHILHASPTPGRNRKRLRLKHIAG
jgi:hypothetical protein